MGVLFSVYRSQEIAEKISIIYATDRFAFPCTLTKSAGARRRDCVADVRTTLWDRRVSVNDSADGSADGVVPGPQAEFSSFGLRPLFALWAWGVFAASTSTGAGFVGGTAWAGGSMAASVPFMVIEQTV